MPVGNELSSCSHSGSEASVIPRNWLLLRERRGEECVPGGVGLRSGI